MQTGTVDGQENPTTNILRNKLYEVQDYLAITRHQYVTQPLVMNKAKFEALPAEYQQIMLDAGKEVAALDVKMVEEAESGQLEELKEQGMTITEPDTSEFRTALQPLYDAYVDEYGGDFSELLDLMAQVK